MNALLPMLAATAQAPPEPGGSSRAEEGVSGEDLFGAALVAALLGGPPGRAGPIADSSGGDAGLSAAANDMPGNRGLARLAAATNEASIVAAGISLLGHGGQEKALMRVEPSATCPTEFPIPPAQVDGRSLQGNAAIPATESSSLASSVPDAVPDVVAAPFAGGPNATAEPTDGQTRASSPTTARPRTVAKTEVESRAQEARNRLSDLAFGLRLPFATNGSGSVPLSPSVASPTNRELSVTEARPGAAVPRAQATSGKDAPEGASGAVSASAATGSAETKGLMPKSAPIPEPESVTPGHVSSSRDPLIAVAREAPSDAASLQVNAQTDQASVEAECHVISDPSMAKTASHTGPSAKRPARDSEAGTSPTGRPFAGAVPESVGRMGEAYRTTEPLQTTLATAEDLVSQVTHHLRLLRIEGSNEVHMKLQPPALGHLSVQVKVEEGRVSVQVLADSLATKSMLEASLPQLQSALTEGGLRPDRLVVLASQNGAFFDAATPRRSRQGETPLLSRASAISRQRGIDAVVMDAASWRPLGLVDYRV